MISTNGETHMNDDCTDPVSEAELRAFLFRIANMDDLFKLPPDTPIIRAIPMAYNDIRHAATQMVGRMRINRQLPTGNHRHA